MVDKKSWLTELKCRLIKLIDRWMIGKWMVDG